MVKNLKPADLIMINGGSILKGSVLNALARGIDIILQTGRSLGSAIRRIIGGKPCRV